MQLQTHNTSRNVHNKSGFTFVETLVAITVLLVAVVAPMSLAQDGIVAAKLSQDQIVAFYLGQEGIEVVKNLRDGNRLANASGQLAGANLLNCVVTDPEDATEYGCIVDATRTPGGSFWTETCIGECEPIRIDTIGGLNGAKTYSYLTTNTTATKYTRTVKVWYPDGLNTDEAVVRVTVSWLFGKTGQIKTYQIQNYLYNW